MMPLKNTGVVASLAARVAELEGENAELARRVVSAEAALEVLRRNHVRRPVWTYTVTAAGRRAMRGEELPDALPDADVARAIVADPELRAVARREGMI